MSTGFGTDGFDMSQLDQMDEQEIRKCLAAYDARFQSKDGRHNVLLTLDWKKRFPTGAGVYAFFKDGIIVYVGETGSIQGRMNDMRSSQHHTLRRNVGAREFCDVPGYEKASSHKKFPVHIEKLVITFLYGFEVTTLSVGFGRKEIEEYLIAKYEPIYNQKARRGAV